LLRLLVTVVAALRPPTTALVAVTARAALRLLDRLGRLRRLQGLGRLRPPAGLVAVLPLATLAGTRAALGLTTGRLDRRPGGLAGQADRPAARRPPDRGAVDEHPAHVGHGLAAHQPSRIEQPVVLTVELLERVVGQDRRLGPIGDLQDERIAPPDRPGRRGDDLARGHRVLVDLALAAGDAVRERRVDDDRHDLWPELGHEGLHRVVELRQAGELTTLSGDVRTVDDQVS
jgi:hypothetical protein